MKNEKVIVLAGWAHGGTNIVWNLLQSHPEICSSGVETGELLRRSPALLAGLIASGACGLGAVRRFVDRRLFEAKMSNLASPENRFVTEGVAYTSERPSWSRKSRRLGSPVKPSWCAANCAPCPQDCASARSR